MTTETTTIVPDEDGNYDSPALQSLYAVWEDYESEVIDEQAVLDVISQLETFVQQQIDGMERDAQSSTVDVHDANRLAILTGFQDHLKGLEKMRSAFSAGSFDPVDEAFELIQAATNRMMLGYQGLVEDEAHLGLILCVKCSHENQRSSSFCGKCGAILPKLEQHQEKRLIAVSESDGSDDLDGETTPNYIEVAEAHEAWQKERSGPEEFARVLATVRRRHADQHAEILQTLAESEAAVEDAELLQHLEEYSQVLEANAAALDTMLGALERGDSDGVETGLTELAEATVNLLEAEKRGEAMTLAEGETSEARSF